MTGLTESEKEVLREWARGDEVYTDDWDGTLFATVESILLARETALRETIAQAWDQGWTHGVGYSTGQTLNPFSNPYRGQA